MLSIERERKPCGDNGCSGEGHCIDAKTSGWEASGLRISLGDGISAVFGVRWTSADVEAGAQAMSGTD